MDSREFYYNESHYMAAGLSFAFSKPHHVSLQFTLAITGMYAAESCHAVHTYLVRHSVDLCI